MNQLFKLTPMERTFGVTMLAIVNGRPQVMGIKAVLLEFINHRREVIVRRARFELAKARARLHILEGFRIALENIDEVVELIKSSESTPAAKQSLQTRFSLSEIQAQQILDMPLKRLTGLERKAIDDEYTELLAFVTSLEKLLADKKAIDALIITELREISEKYGDKRRTVIEESTEEIEVEDMIVEEDMVVSISHKGYAKRCSPSIYRAQRRGGKGVMGTKKLAEDNDDFVSDLFVASTHAYLLNFTSEGKLHWLKVYKLPLAGRTARGRAIINILELDENERITSILPVREFTEGKFVTMLTRKGYIKRVDLMAFSNIRKGGIRAATVDEGDELIGAVLTEGDRDYIVSTKEGMAIRFSEADVRAMGRTARGVRAIKLDGDDEVVNIVTVPSDESKSEGVTLLTVCENGFGKRTDIAEYRCQSRSGKGVIDIKTTDRNGLVVGTSRVTDSDQAMIITTGGKVIRCRMGDISTIGRNTQGVNLITLEENEKVAAIARLAESDSDDEQDSEEQE
jgi:DNA gyrase subunit A